MRTRPPKLVEKCALAPAVAARPGGPKAWAVLPCAKTACCRNCALRPTARCAPHDALLVCCSRAGASRASYSSLAHTGRRCPCSSTGRSCCISTARAYPTSSSWAARSTTCFTTTPRPSSIGIRVPLPPRRWPSSGCCATRGAPGGSGGLGTARGENLATRRPTTASGARASHHYSRPIPAASKVAISTMPQCHTVA